MFGGVWKMTPKRPLIDSKGPIFSKNRHILTPNRNLREWHLACKNTAFFAFLWSGMCTTLLFKCPPAITHRPYLTTKMAVTIITLHISQKRGPIPLGCIIYTSCNPTPPCPLTMPFFNTILQCWVHIITMTQVMHL